MDEAFVGGHPLFKQWKGRGWPWGPSDTFEGLFGGNVLAGLNDGLDKFLADDWHRRRKPGVLGCTPWLTDEAVVDRLVRFTECCIVINKPESTPNHLSVVNDQTERLRESGPGWFRDVLPGISSSSMAPKVDDKPVMVGPAGPYTDDEPPTVFESVRVAGMRKGSRGTIPLVHAKLVLVGLVHWTDDHPSGYAVEQWSFEPRQLWLGSANLTANSRRSLEFGIWVDDPKILSQATEFLTDLLAYSEPLGSASAEPDPELEPYEYDEEAMWEAVREMRYYGEPDPDEEP